MSQNRHSASPRRSRNSGHAWFTILRWPHLVGRRHMRLADVLAFQTPRLSARENPLIKPPKRLFPSYSDAYLFGKPPRPRRR